MPVGQRGPGYVCSTLWDPSPSITCDGWTAGGEMLEVKFCGHVNQRFQKYNITGYDRFVGPLSCVVGCFSGCRRNVTDSADWSQWVRYALDVTASIPQPFDECAVTFQQFRPEATRRLAGCKRRTDLRGMEIVDAFNSEMIADEPSLLEDVDFL